MTQSQDISRLARLKSFVDEDPNDPFLHFALAKEYEKLEDEEQALHCYLHLVSNHDDYVGTYYHLGKLYERRQDFEKAILTYTQGLEMAKIAKDSHSASELQGALDLIT